MYLKIMLDTACLQFPDFLADLIIVYSIVYVLFIANPIQSTMDITSTIEILFPEMVLLKKTENPPEMTSFFLFNTGLFPALGNCLSYLVTC